MVKQSSRKLSPGPDSIAPPTLARISERLRSSNLAVHSSSRGHVQFASAFCSVSFRWNVEPANASEVCGYHHPRSGVHGELGRTWQHDGMAPKFLGPTDENRQVAPVTAWFRSHDISRNQTKSKTKSPYRRENGIYLRSNAADPRSQESRTRSFVSKPFFLRDSSDHAGLASEPERTFTPPFVAC